MMSTFSRSSCLANSSFCSDVIEKPGDCSPSRSVVSKILTLSTVNPRGVGFWVSGDRDRGLYPSHLSPDTHHLSLLLDEGHHRPELGAHLLDMVLGALGPHRLQSRRAGHVLQDPGVGEGAVLDVAQELAHRLADVLVDHARAGVV